MVIKKGEIVQELGLTKRALKKQQRVKLHQALNPRKVKRQDLRKLNVQLSEQAGNKVEVEQKKETQMLPGEQESIERLQFFYPTASPGAGIELRNGYADYPYLFIPSNADLGSPQFDPVDTKQYRIYPWELDDGSEGVCAVALNTARLYYWLEKIGQKQGCYFFVSRHPCVVGDRLHEDNAFFPLGVTQDADNYVALSLLWSLQLKDKPLRIYRMAENEVGKLPNAKKSEMLEVDLEDVVKRVFANGALHASNPEFE